MDSTVTDSPEQLQQYPCEIVFVVVVKVKLIIFVKKTGAPKPPKRKLSRDAGGITPHSKGQGLVGYRIH